MIDFDQEMDIGDAVQNLAKRVSELEGDITSPDVMTGPLTDEFPGGITIGTTPVSGAVPTPPTAISVSPSTHFDDIVADISWTPAVGTTAVEYEVELAWKNGMVYQSAQKLRTGGTQVRATALRPDSTYGVRVYAVNRIGMVSTTPYPSSGWQDFSTTHDATTPSLPTGLTLTAGVRSLVAVWTGVSDVDVVNGNGQYELQIATDSGFTTGVRSKFFGGDIGGFTDLLPQTQYWARVRAVDATGNAGPWTAGASITTAAVQTGDMAVNSVDATVIANGTILEAKIGDAQITNAKIVSLVVDKVSAGTIASKDYVLGAGGQIKTAALAPGILLNSQGLSLYDGSGTRTVYLDGTTGSATFTGSITGSTITGSVIQNAASGQRFRLSSSPFNGFEMYSGLGSSKPGRLIALPWPSDTSRPLVRLEGERTAGGHTSPHIDMIGGGSDGYARIDLIATDIVVNATTGYLRYAGTNRVVWGSSSVEVHSVPLSLNDQALYLRAWNDATHRIVWTNDQINYHTWAHHRFYINNDEEFRISNDEVRVETPYLYVHAGNVRIGEVYGNHGVYSAAGALRFDYGPGDMYISRANSTMIHFGSDHWIRMGAEFAMQGISLCLSSAGDYARRVYHHTGWDAEILAGWGFSALHGSGNDNALEAGHYGSEGRCVNIASNAWRDFTANICWDGSDPALKKDIRPIREPVAAKGRASKPEKQLEKVKAIKPIRFKWKHGKSGDSPDQEFFGFDASTLPYEVTKKAKIRREDAPLLEEGGKPELAKHLTENTMIHPTGLLAILWAAVQELTDEVEDLKSQLQPA